MSGASDLVPRALASVDGDQARQVSITVQHIIFKLELTRHQCHDDKHMAPYRGAMVTATTVYASDHLF